MNDRPIMERGFVGPGRDTPDPRRGIYAREREAGAEAWEAGPSVSERRRFGERFGEAWGSFAIALGEMARALALVVRTGAWASLQHTRNATRSANDVTRSAIGFVARTIFSLKRTILSLTRKGAGLVRDAADFIFKAVGSAIRLVVRGIFSPITLAAVLPIAVLSVGAFYLVDPDSALRGLVEEPAAQWIASLQIRLSEGLTPETTKSDKLTPRAKTQTATSAPAPPWWPSELDGNGPGGEIAAVAAPSAQVASIPSALAAVRAASPAAAALLESGRAAATKTQFDKAIHDFSEAIRIDPDYPGSYAERGQILFKRNEIDRAIADYTAALARDANYAPALRGRGMAHLYRGASDLAIADLTSAILATESDPSRLSSLDLFYARRSRASLYGEKKQYDGEIADCTAIITAYEQSSALGDVLKATYGGAGAKNLVVMIYRQRANAQMLRSNNEAALGDLTAAISLSADHGYTALLDRARAYEALGQRDRAAADL
jgi:hypothetical protein